ncbi:MAG: FumA C-terminus/TtdB family hydratase beta subunit [Candidatus Neomarinimicrobiota bacterium]|jgi:fumarate hydratase class I|nr:FumA C-terminus/TtdB family hydratase beta subunit [bacterium]
MTRKLKLILPTGASAVRELRAGDTLLLSGSILTARDRAHQWLAEEKPENMHALLSGGALYHCGPIMLRQDNRWICKAAGPTSSLRQEAFMATIICEYGIRCIIGKGGMGEASAEALRQYGAVYCSAVGGAAVLYANAVESVEKVFRLEDFGMPEALWLMHIRDFPVMVSMDAQGNSLYRDVEAQSRRQYRGISKP